MFWKAWKANQQTTPQAMIRPAPARRAAIRSPRQHSSANSTMIAARADEAELLPGDAEHEVGLLLGHERAVGLRAVEQAGAEQVPVRDRDVGLVDVVGRALHVLASGR